MLTLCGLIAALLALALGSGVTGATPSRSTLEAQAANSKLATGFSEKRVVLSRAEQSEAAQRGLLPAGTHTILRTQGPMTHGQWYWDNQGVPAGRLSVRVDPSRQIMSVFRGPHEIGTAIILYGAKGKETPRGRLPILGKTRDHHSRAYDAPMPYSLWLTSDGVAIHGTSVTMGRASNGCIGVPVAFAAKLFAAARKGDVVEVLS